MSIKDEVKNASHLVKGGVEKAAGDVTGNDHLAHKGEEEVVEAEERQAVELEQRKDEEGESKAEPHSTMEGVLHADER